MTDHDDHDCESVLETRAEMERDAAEPTLTLFSSSLLSKWGFNDGDAPDDVLDYCEERGLGWRIEWRETILPALARRFLLPALEQDVTLVDISTNHNPIRAETVDGVDVTDCWYESSDCGPDLTPECVEVPLAEIVRAIQEARAKPGDSSLLAAKEGDAQ